MPEADATFETIASGYYLEALLIDGDAVWYTDVVTGGVCRVGSDICLLPERRMIGGLLLNDDGCLLVAGDGGILWVDPVDGASGVLVDGFGGVNEMRADGRGGIYFGTIDLPAILRGAKPEASVLYHLAADRTLTRLADGLTFANGLSPSVDGSRLFFNESFSGVCAWPVGADGSLGERLWSLAKYDCDGMALDAGGDLWVTGFASGELLRLSPDGAEIGRVALPGVACTNVRFGGADMRDLYVTMVDPRAAAALAAGRMPEGQDSRLLKGRSPVAGAPMAKAGFALK